MKKMFIGVHNLANCVTYLGIAAAVVGVCFASTPKIAMLMLIVSGICDLFDGRVARMFPRTDLEKAFGIQLDSFADTVSFVIFPAVFLIAQLRTVWTVLLAVFYVYCGVTRLCWFDITTDGDTKFFSGVPVTYISLFLPLLYAVGALFGLAVSPIIIGVLMLVPEIILILGGKAYIGAVYCLPPLIASCVFQFIYTMYVNIEFYKKKTIGVSIATMIATAINIVLNLIFIPMNPEHSYVIAAYTTLVGYIVLFILHYFIVKRMKMEFVYDIKFILGALALTLIVSGVMNLLYRVTFARYAIVLVYGAVILCFAYRYKDEIIGIFKTA